MESINPRDFSELDLSTIEYLTLKNGNMILLDETVPEKKKKIKRNKIDFNRFQKFNYLSISEPIIVYYKSLSMPNHIKTSLDNDNIIIFKNENIFIKNIKQKDSLKFIYNKKYNKNDLRELRNKIDEIDKIIIDAFIERMEIVKDIRDYKKENNLPIYDSLREKELLVKRKEMANNISFNNDIENLFKLILKISKEHQNNDLDNTKNNAQDINYENNNIKENEIFENKLKLNKLNLNNKDKAYNDHKLSTYKDNETFNIISNDNINENILIKDSINDLNTLNNDDNLNKNNINNFTKSITERRVKRMKTLEEKNEKKLKNKGRNKNYINAVCSLNIPSDFPRNINIIEKFNSLVDKLNNQKLKAYNEKKENEEKERINKKYYKIIQMQNNQIPIDIKINKNNNIKNNIRRNILNLYKNKNLNWFNSLNKDNTSSKINFNKNRINDKRNNIEEYKIKFNELKTDRTNENNKTKFIKYKRNNSSIVLPSNKYYHYK